MNSTHECYIRIDDDHEDFPVDVSYEIYNDGIGSYEYWGAKCYDKGQTCLDIDEIIPIFINEPPEEREMITQYIKENYDKLIETLDQQIWQYLDDEKDRQEEDRAESRYLRAKYGDY